MLSFQHVQVQYKYTDFPTKHNIKIYVLRTGKYEGKLNILQYSTVLYIFMADPHNAPN
jgi:hypothetical protein